ncbi:MAG TPA: TetR/AcrR family transcriptional regulator [Acidimicrobiales bacterium]|nr:TetR/AcrR family transcriptional regulator [Acidimicrobiales bacterium]
MAVAAPEPDPAFAGPATRGRKRDATRDDALCQAAIELLAEVGYDRLTIEAVAARARAGKGTVYRRWANKAELVADALAQRSAAMELPDTGTLRGDLLVLIAGKGSDENQEFHTRLLIGLVPALVQFPELRDAFERTRGSHALQIVLARAVDRGEIAPLKDPDMIAALLPALSLHRFVISGAPLDRSFARRVVDHVLLPLVLGQPTPAARPRRVRAGASSAPGPTS